jgi:hypothetical protein
MAALRLSGDSADDSAWRSIVLLRDVRRVFAERPEADRLYAAGLATALNELHDAPWGACSGGRGLDSRSLWPKPMNTPNKSNRKVQRNTEKRTTKGEMARTCFANYSNRLQSGKI